MKKFIIQVILLISVIGGAIFLFNPNSSWQSPDFTFFPRVATSSILEINGAKIKIEIADTPSERNKGLGGKESLASDSGMLFVFERGGMYPFWMKGLKFALDFVWIKNSQVVDVLENVLPPEPGQTDENLPIYTSKVDADKVLEVPAGTVQRLNIKVGDTIQIIK